MGRMSEQLQASNRTNLVNSKDGQKVCLTIRVQKFMKGGGEKTKTGNHVSKILATVTQSRSRSNAELDYGKKEE